MVPAAHHAINQSLLDELRRTGKSPTGMANQVAKMMHLKFERANMAYLLACQNVLDSESEKYSQKSITGFIRKETQTAPFGEYDDADGWNGLSVSAHYLTDCLLYEYQHQQEAIQRLLQGTFGQAFRSDHTRKVSRKRHKNRWKPMYQGLANHYSNANVEKAQYQWVDRDCCAAFRVPDPKETEHLNWDAWRTVDVVIAEASFW
ncbi:hypothetical protein Baya_15230 [Bagarius yarrelli]|uniref:Uncharacterized protein n=1 Tax=Bagarius yarrelli TaxID=175774 RepID=A0A556VV69_BAGYA|nr:hypothetical protein Baya_15230 [Bagarius yarrelli]